ncbi:conserved hypothetical protein [Vibrio nigripulchritudo SO65]|uniref:YecA/YgfB family protein n=1 Tax=Vibrio nigripulchritudo TaxID=28173 RepID=UPI0003B1E94B|nr:YecA family protein [Vibrio nigripulchritudo]CCN36140.1 conserved hypothetical protein [Vibrio nigripulchritudo AM115]CCN44815.1 conserved hypothetical protein [Vibrio nigripulchritudo FTn2]CCN68137.1 conserved hypothetical protein [Vibrio nigripulchritudo POn4]CCN74569.1 conserved hypothetical protein [Vibrio nigripulchritudo SO65]
MSDVTHPTYQQLTNELKSAQLAVSPAELHGLLTGMLSGGLTANDNSWQPLLFDYTNDGMGWPISTVGTAENLLKATLKELAANQFELTLLLAEQEGDLFATADGLSDWINHFISGFGLANQALQKVPTDVKEALGDLEEISKLGIDEEDDLNEQAILLEQVIEHVKACVLTVHAEFGVKPSELKKPTIH